MAVRFAVEFTETAAGHLLSYKKSESNPVLDAIKAQLPYQPTEEARNRRLLRDNPLADWELRVGKFRVFYEVDSDQAIVRIVAVGHKEHNKLFVGGEEIEL
jgi:mRNA-degrading endonuclease RelE of RelBE toxin-antitoxin system